MAIDISLLNGRLSALTSQKRAMQAEYERKIKDLDAEIEAEKQALDRIHQLLLPYFCSYCDGTGKERYMDAAGSRDYRSCKHCHGTGVEPIVDNKLTGE